MNIIESEVLLFIVAGLQMAFRHASPEDLAIRKNFIELVEGSSGLSDAEIITELRKKGLISAATEQRLQVRSLFIICIPIILCSFTASNFRNKRILLLLYKRDLKPNYLFTHSLV